MTEYTFDSITPGEAWGCRFRTHTFCDEDGTPIRTPTHLQPGQAHPGTPQTYESTGVIAQRDTQNRRLIVVDIHTHQDFVVEERDAWDYDRVEFVDE